MKQPKQNPRIQAPLLALMIIALALVLGVLRPLPLPISAAVRSAGFVLAAFGFLFGLFALIAFRKTRQANNKPALVTSGVYRISRNPVALGFLVMLIGIPLNAGSIWGLILAPAMIVLFNWFVIGPEEKVLSARFGNDYEKYRQSVRRWL
jgi:protein-S-isoprenylcysteine O-methyltransferase Ste14